jgi:hypothetical protein
VAARVGARAGADDAGAAPGFAADRLAELRALALAAAA